MFKVFDNNQPAKFPNHKVHSSWDQNEFKTLDEAINYADRWLGGYGPWPHNKPGQYDYSGEGDILEIREE